MRLVYAALKSFPNRDYPVGSVHSLVKLTETGLNRHDLFTQE